MDPILSVVAPCYNESGNLPELAERLLSVFKLKSIRGEVVFVNDGSLDNTGEIIDRLASEFPERIKSVHHSVNKGIEAGWRSGVAASSGEYVCLIDADLQNLPEDVYRLLREIQNSGGDMVQGFRSSVGRLKDSRYSLSKGLNAILNFCFGMNLKDNKSGFVISRREVMQEVLTHRLNYNYFQSFITVSANAKGYQIREIETLFVSRLSGKSFLPQFPLKVIFRVMVDIAKAIWEYRIAPKRESMLADFLRSHKPLKQDAPMSLHRKAWFNLFFMTMPLHKWMLTRQTKKYYEELKRSQYLSLADMQKLQEKKLQRLMAHAYYHVGFYRDRLDSLGLKPSDFKTIEDLSKLPFLEKSDVRKNLYFDLLSDNHDKKRILKITTSGSTGEPFVCFADQHQLEIRWAATLRSMEWTGYRWGDRCARLWHQTLGMSLSQIVREKIDAWFNRRLFIPAFEMSDENISKFVMKLKKFQPVLIDGYAESFNFMAHYIKNFGLDEVRPKGIISSAQVLPEQSRRIIEKAFDCGVYDKYGSREFSGIAYECEAHDGHHVVAENYIVEILKDGKPVQPGEMGEVVITDLNNLCLPMIRYRVGDLAMGMDKTANCTCGRGLPKIGKIEGRVQAIIIGTNGAYIPGTFFAHLFKDYDHAIRQYQIVQEEPNRVKLRIIKALRFSDEVFGEILNTLKKFLGADIQIDVEFTDRIEMVRTGKHQGSISKLSIDFQNKAK